MIIKEYKEVDGIKIFHENIDHDHKDYNSKGLDQIHEQEEKHFWFIARKEYILKNFQKYINKNNKIIEIGAGTGNVARFLQKHGYKNINIGEMHLNGLKYAQNYGLKELYQFDLLDTPFENEFDVVCMFDVLEHIENDKKALENVSKMLVDGGKIVLTVPAHMWLWSKIDVLSGHKIRYTKKELIKKLEDIGFKILYARYFFINIIPLLYLRKMLNEDRKDDIDTKEIEEVDISINPLINEILIFGSRIENKINRFLPNWFGGSLFVIGEKV